MSSRLPQNDDLQATWAFLERGISHIMVRLHEDMSPADYMNLYTVVYNFCTANKAASMKTVGQNPTQGAQLGGADLYNNLISYFSGHLNGLNLEASRHHNEDLLKCYAKTWVTYTTASSFLHHVFKYLNRHWVKREIDEGRKNVYDVYTLALVRWKVDMFDHIQQQIMESVLMLIEKQRNGEYIEANLIKSVVDSYVSLGLDENDSSKTTLDVYKQCFETPFLVATATYYKAESEKFVSENSVVEYMKKAESRLNEEEARVNLYLHSSTQRSLLKSCETVLIKSHADILHEEFQSLLNNDRQADLQRMYSLLSRVPESLDPLRVKFEAHVRKAGLAAVERVAGPIQDEDPKSYVDSLLEVHQRYHDLVERAFVGDADFVKSLDNACREFVNRNSVCKSSSSKSPELLARYCDSLLKKSAKNAEESDLEVLLTGIMTVFKYVEDRDVFQKFYSRMLAKRLVNASSASDDAETSMINKLKEACGFEYTNKLHRMFQDIGVSKDLNDQYKASVADYVENQVALVDFQVLVLGTGAWPLQVSDTHYNIPQEIVKTYERFQSFYGNKHSGRRLAWLWHMSKAELKATYLKNTKQLYTFQVSMFQLAILLAFNDALSLSYENLLTITNIRKDVFDGAMGILVKAKILLIQPASSAVGDEGTCFELNVDFRSKKIRVNLNLPIRTEQKQEVEETHKTIDEDRRLLMQSAIVRIMKARKTLKHVVLVQETIQQIKSRFTPKVQDIKKAIDSLIEKEYLERLDGDKYQYLA